MVGLLTKSYDCKKCGEEHAFGSWVYAHWDENVNHVCLSCGTEHVILRGEARLVLREAKV